MCYHKVFLASYLLILFFITSSFSQTGIKTLKTPKVDLAKDTTLYTIGYSHLDTEWRWDYQTTIREYVKNTMLDNFKLFDKYPNYVFNFSGANRYRMMKEYYPDHYEKVKEYVAENRWFPSGSSMEENDALIPSAESILRQILYGNDYFRKEFGVASNEYMLPDCFGFPASLPSILAHCGISGFSTQKLTWGSAVGIPFNVGRWIGPDSSSVVAAFNPGDYVGQVKEDLSVSPKWLKRITDLGLQSNIWGEYMYYGTGDIGGAPTDESVQWIEKSIEGNGPIRVLSSSATQFFDDLTSTQKEKLPSYRGELLLTNHSAGSITSQAYMKRWNRKNELLAYSAEAASVAGNWLGGTTYPQPKLNEAWRLLLGTQFHDILAGTCTPRSYEFSWNDEVLAANQFAGVLTDAVGAVARALDTRAKGIPLVIYNSLSIEREDVVEATVTFPGEVPKAIKVFDPKNKEVPSQVINVKGNQITLLFVARVPSVGFISYDVRPSPSPCVMKTNLEVTNNSIENERYKVLLNYKGDVNSIFDKSKGKELLSEPARLVFLRERPQSFPAWNMDWDDRENPPVGFVEGPAIIRVVESGSVRVALEVERESRGSKFIQHIRLSAGGGGEHVEFDTKIDWFTHESSLKASFPLTVSNPMATYHTNIGTIERRNNEKKKFEVPSHQWFDLTDQDGSYGVSVLEDCKFGSDKPTDNMVRLTLLYTPGAQGEFKDQASQDFGKHEMMYALYGHEGDWRDGNSCLHAARFNQPLHAFQTVSHKGTLGKSFSFLRINNPNIAVDALKKAENSDEIILRVHETKGMPAKGVEIGMAATIVSASEIDGQERRLSEVTLRDGILTFDMNSYHMKSFAVKLGESSVNISLPRYESIDLPFNADVISADSNKADGGFDKSGAALPAELLPDMIISEAVAFKLGSKINGANNALTCNGQTIELPKGRFNRLYFLAAASDVDSMGTFAIDGKSVELTISNWSGFIGQWDNRMWDGYEPKKQDYAWDNIYYTGITPGYIKRDNVAFFTTHRHLANGENDPYSYGYLFKYGIDISRGAGKFTLPVNQHIHLLALTVAYNDNDVTRPASTLFDTLGWKKEDYERFQMCLMPRILPESYILEENKPITVTIISKDAEAEIRYTLDGSDPTSKSEKYTEPITIDKTTTVKALAYSPVKHPSAVTEATYYRAYRITSVSYLSKYSPKYDGTGDGALMDSRRGTTSYANKAWQGFEENDMEIIVDLGISKPLHKVTVSCLSDNTSWIFLPSSIEIAASGEKSDFKAIAVKDYQIPKSNEGTFVKELSIDLNNINTRYLRIKAKNLGKCPSWHSGAGGKSWLFIDEIIVE